MPSSFADKVDIYQSLLFHSGPFKRITGYNRITPYECVAAAKAGDYNCFSALLPSTLLLADPFMNDAVLHAVQVCVPDKLLLPVAISHIEFLTMESAGETVIHATEIWQQGDEYTYDITVMKPTGETVQQWSGVRFRALQNKPNRKIPPELAGVLIQRRLDKLSGNGERITVHLGEADTDDSVIKRTDGKPTRSNGYVSRSGKGSTKLQVKAGRELSCDIEQVQEQAEDAWQTLLGAERFKLANILQAETGHDLSTTATMVWCATECVRKCGLQTESPLLLERYDMADDIVYMNSSGSIVALFKLLMEGHGARSIVAVLLKHKYEETI